DSIFPTPSRMTPAARVALEWNDAYAFVAGKMITMLDERPGIQVPHPYGSALGGVGIDLFDLLALETGGGWFSRGTSPNPGTRGEPLPAFGISSRAALHL